MSEKTYWRGYIDAQNKTDWVTKQKCATAHKKEMLKPLQVITGRDIQEFRSGYMIVIPRIDKVLPQKFDADYIKGWFKGRGQRYAKPSLKLTVSGTNVVQFAELVKKHVGIELPKPMKPSATSNSRRIIITGEKAKQLDEWLRA